MGSLEVTKMFGRCIRSGIWSYGRIRTRESGAANESWGSKAMSSTAMENTNICTRIVPMAAFYGPRKDVRNKYLVPFRVRIPRNRNPSRSIRIKLLCQSSVSGWRAIVRYFRWTPGNMDPFTVLTSVVDSFFVFGPGTGTI